MGIEPTDAEVSRSLLAPGSIRFVGSSNVFLADELFLIELRLDPGFGRNGLTGWFGTTASKRWGWDGKKHRTGGGAHAASR